MFSVITCVVWKQIRSIDAKQSTYEGQNFWFYKNPKSFYDSIMIMKYISFLEIDGLGDI
jgi:hypothetical protein